MRALPSVCVVALDELAVPFPHLRFAVRSADGLHLGHDAGARHPLAGTGKLVLACAVARLAARDPDLLGGRLTLTGARRKAARSGTLRLMSGEPALTVDDAMALIVGTGDAMCVLAVLEHLRERGADVVAEARAHATDLGLQDTEITGLEGAGLPDGGRAGGVSWGEGLTGMTTPSDLCTLLATLPEPVRGWMDTSFEPAGLASGLPGFGPHTVPHQTVAGGDLLEDESDKEDSGLPHGWASVLVLPGAVVAAFLPARLSDGTVVSPLEASTTLGTLGLSVWQDLNA